jgi:hypothetical protein
MENKMIENFRGIVNGVEYNDVLSFVQALEEQSGKPNNVIRKSLKLPLIEEPPVLEEPCNCELDECVACRRDMSVEQKIPVKKRIYSRPGIYETDEQYIIPAAYELNLNALLTENDLEKFDNLLENRFQYLNQLLHSGRCELDFNLMMMRINKLKSQVNIWLDEALAVKNYFSEPKNNQSLKYFENYNNLQKGLSSLVGYLDCIYDVCIKEKESRISEDFLRFVNENNFSNEICSTFLMLGLRNE